MKGLVKSSKKNITADGWKRRDQF